MPTFRVEVGYGHEPSAELGSGLTPERTEQAVGAFMRDMLGLEGSAVTRVVIEREPEQEKVT